MDRSPIPFVQRTSFRHAARGGLIDWTRPASEIAAAIDRATRNGVPMSTSINGQAVQVVAARVGGIRSAYAPGTMIRCDDEAWVQAGEGHVIVELIRDAADADAPAAETFIKQGIVAGHCFDVPQRTHATQAA